MDSASQHDAIERLARCAVAGDLTLEEYAERLDAVRRAADAAGVEQALQGLSDGDRAPADGAKRPRFLLAVLGGSEQRGVWRLSRRLWVIAALGGTTLDLGRAQLEAHQSVITVVAFMGGVELIAPVGLPIQLSGLSLLGGKSDERPGGAILPGAPLVRVRAITILGGLSIRERRAGRAPTAAST